MPEGMQRGGRNSTPHSHREPSTPRAGSCGRRPRWQRVAARRKARPHARTLVLLSTRRHASLVHALVCSSLTPPFVHSEAPVQYAAPGVRWAGGCGTRSPQHACAHASPCRVSAACPARERARNYTKQSPRARGAHVPVRGTANHPRTRTHTGGIYPRRCTRGRPGENIAGRARCCEVEHARPRSGLLLPGSAAGGGICAGLTLTPLVTSPSLLPS